MCSEQCRSVLCGKVAFAPHEERAGGGAGGSSEAVPQFFCGGGIAHESRASSTLGTSEQGQGVCLISWGGRHVLPVFIFGAGAGE
jgi:hypothetical protein